MRNGNNSIGIAVTVKDICDDDCGGDDSFNGNVLKKFFVNYYKQKTGSVLPPLQCEINNGKHFYCLVKENVKWEPAHRAECTKLLKAVNKAGLSYYFCNFDSRVNEAVQQSNGDQDFFDYRVRRLFGISKTLQFEDMRHSTFKDWMQGHFDRADLVGICENGADGGWGGMTHYTETTELYNRYHCDIWEMLNEDCPNVGHTSVLEMVSEFRDAHVHNDEQFKNLLVLNAAERTAREIIESDDSENDESSDDDDDDEISDDNEEE